jgi:hypothetical protein
VPDGTIYITYDLGRRSEKMIMMDRFTEEDILTGCWISPRARPHRLISQATGVITEAESWDRLREQDDTREKLIYTGI